MGHTTLLELAVQAARCHRAAHVVLVLLILEDRAALAAPAASVECSTHVQLFLLVILVVLVLLARVSCLRWTLANFIYQLICVVCP